MAQDGYKVSLNVYDLSQGLARQLSPTFLGKAIEAVWHTGIVVYENEYYFGAGIQHSPTGITSYGTPVRVVDLGITHVPKDLFEEYLQEITPRYTAETYNVLHHNCNCFSNEVAQFLVGTTIPDYILQLPNEVMNSPMGAMMLPLIHQLEMTMKSGGVPRAPQFAMPQPTQSRTSVSTSHESINSSFSSRDAPISSRADGPTKSDSCPFYTGNMPEKPQNTQSTVSPAVKPAEMQENNSNGVAKDPLGEARKKVQQEIGKEFAKIMATRTLCASEAATLATRRVMERNGMLKATTPHS
ncbi:hypothetical protein AAC387_Pa05g0387 [Persea americana]